MPLVNSAVLAIGTLAIAMPVGVLLAVAFSKFSIPGKRYAAAAIGVLLFLPLYLQLTAWDAAVGKLGWLTLASGSMAEPLLGGMRGAIFVHGVAAIPWVAAIVGLGLSQVDPAQEQAALLVLPPGAVLWKLSLRQASPFIAAAAVWTAVATAAEMTVTNIYLIDPGQQTFTERFYMSLALSADATQATVDVLPGAISLGVLLCAAVWMVNRLNGNRVFLRHLRMSRPLGRLGFSWVLLLWVSVLLLVAVPVASLVIKAGFVVLQDQGRRVPGWSLESCVWQVLRAPRHFSREILDTVQVAAGAATLALVVGGALGWSARRGGWRAALAMAAIVLGLAVPGPLVGAALVQTLNHDVPPRLALNDGTFKSWLLILYDDTPVGPVLAQAIRALPLVTLLLWYGFATLHRGVLEAAALDGLSPWKVFWRVAVPLCRRAILAAWITGFAIAAGDLAWAHLVTPPGLDLLSRRVFGLVHSGVEEQVAAIGLLLLAAYGGLAAGIAKLLAPRAST